MPHPSCVCAGCVCGGMRSHALVATMGDEVDRLEAIVRRELPEVRHVDLEII
jgi:hypothetical protein